MITARISKLSATSAKIILFANVIAAEVDGSFVFTLYLLKKYKHLGKKDTQMVL